MHIKIILPTLSQVNYNRNRTSRRDRKHSQEIPVLREELRSADNSLIVIPDGSTREQQEGYSREAGRESEHCEQYREVLEQTFISGEGEAGRLSTPEICGDALLKP